MDRKLAINLKARTMWSMYDTVESSVADKDPVLLGHTDPGPLSTKVPMLFKFGKKMP